MDLEGLQARKAQQRRLRRLADRPGRRQDPAGQGVARRVAAPSPRTLEGRHRPRRRPRAQFHLRRAARLHQQPGVAAQFEYGVGGRLLRGSIRTERARRRRRARATRDECRGLRRRRIRHADGAEAHEAADDGRDCEGPRAQRRIARAAPPHRLRPGDRGDLTRAEAGRRRLRRRQAARRPRGGAAVAQDAERKPRPVAEP